MDKVEMGTKTESCTHDVLVQCKPRLWAVEAIQKNSQSLIGGFYKCAECGEIITIHVASVFSEEGTEK